MRTSLCALAVVLLALAPVVAVAEIAPHEPSGWYLEGPGTRSGPFGSAGLCLDLRRRQADAGRSQCVEYGRGYWLVVDGASGSVAMAPAPFATLEACLEARGRTGGAGTCTRRVPGSRPVPGIS
jgi:hypothetical protein